MKIALALTVLAAMGVTAPALADPPEKVTICHAAGLASGPANWITLTLPWNAVYGQAGHFNENGTPQAGHEQDYLGACLTEEPTPTQEAPPPPPPGAPPPPPFPPPPPVASETLIPSLPPPARSGAAWD
jgi:hypothetical protein